jgi:hypothetical protein
MYTDGSAPDEEPWEPATPWHTDIRYLHAADLFDHRYYWEAHEAWEALWHSAEPDSSTHRLLQSLIQYAAAILQNHLGHTGGAARLFERSTQRMRLIQAVEPPCFRGVDLSALVACVRQHLDGGPWPILPMENA